MSLVVFVPLVASVHTIEVPRLSWPVLVLPIVRGRIGNCLLEVE